MGKDKQTAKKRLDKYYRLAKEQGYRSRAAYKLVQLNKKYDFLSNARALLDLCAAPGGWLQVAAKYMPVSSVIVGVDLAPIRPIRRCTTLVEDITTSKCRDSVKKALSGWKVDVVLHDGAPNVGTAWIQDAYSQNELTLMALKLATEFLVPGGWFVTKVFRSSDYNSLLWVFNQLFGKVEATKPAASRNTSAEIFVVCKDFTNAKNIDPKLTDPRYVFKEIPTVPQAINVLKPTKQKRSREGYDESNPLLFKKVSVADFIAAEQPITVLSEFNKLEFDEKSSQYANHPLTTIEIKHCCEDLKVLNRADFKGLLKWRLKMQDLNKPATAPEEEKQEEIPELTEEQQEEILDQELEEKVHSLTAREKRLKKKEAKRRKKQQERTNLNMNVDASDVVQTTGELGLFQLSQVKNDSVLKELSTASMDKYNKLQDPEAKLAKIKKRKLEDMMESAINSDDDEEETDDYDHILNSYLDRMYEEYLNRSKNRVKKQKIGKKEKKDKTVDLWASIPTTKQTNTGDFQPKVTGDIFSSDDEGEPEDSENSDDDGVLEPTESLIVKPVQSLSKKAALWFEQSVFDDLLDTNDLTNPISVETKSETKQNQQKKNKEEKINSVSDTAEGDSEDDFDEPENFLNSDGENDNQEDNDFEVVAEASESDYDSDERAEALALGTVIFKDKGKLSEMLDDAYNRYAWNDSNNLPKWFLEDESEHSKAQLPVTKEMIQQVKERWREINARPIKKVAEAKARKKMKAVKKLEKVKSQANSIASSSELSEREKIRQIEKLYKGTLKKAKPNSVYVVSRSFNKGKATGSKKGAKIKVVDPRLKKDTRAQQRLDKRKGKGGKGGKGGRKKR